MRQVALALACLLSFACGSTRVFEPNPGVYDQLSPEQIERARDARRFFELGNLRRSHELLSQILEEAPRNVPVAVLRQEVRLKLLTEGRETDGVAPPTAPLDGPAARELLHQQLTGRAQVEQSAEVWILTARVAPNPDQMLEDLEWAGQIDSDCIWYHYARAHTLYGQRRFQEVREALEQALEKDGGHLPTLRLEATLLAQAGEIPQAIEVLEYWLAEASDSPFVDPVIYTEAQVDLASLYVQDDESEWALDYLQAVNTRFLVTDAARARALLVRAAALEDQDNLLLALGAAGQAAELRPDLILPLVDKAYLRSRLFGRDAEEESWKELVAVAERERELARLEKATPGTDEEIDFQALLHQLHALTRLERIERDKTAEASIQPQP